MARRLRKLWATRSTIEIWENLPLMGPPITRHESKAAVYRYVWSERANWACNPSKPRKLTVYVDERDGRGFQIYEHIDLGEDE